jgi:hypothetical protein
MNAVVESLALQLVSVACIRSLIGIVQRAQHSDVRMRWVEVGTVEKPVLV